MGGEARQFHTTRWTLVMASAHDQNQTGREALATLCQMREAIASTVSDPAEIEGEVDALCAALAVAQGRI
jgi:hypothetical protein